METCGFKIEDEANKIGPEKILTAKFDVYVLK